MGQDWIKFQKITFEKEEVGNIAEILNINKFEVVGRLLFLWSHFDSQTTNGRLKGVNFEKLDKKFRKKGFCAALESQGWMRQEGDEIVLPNFERHNGETSKSRELAKLRQSRKRSKDDTCHAPRVTPVSPDASAARDQRRGEEKRGEKNRREGDTPPETLADLRDEDPATDLAIHYAFKEGMAGNQPAIKRARQPIADLLARRVDYETIKTEIYRADRAFSEHPGRMRDRLMPGDNGESSGIADGINSAANWVHEGKQ